jgi:hypothetical protein
VKNYEGLRRLNYGEKNHPFHNNISDEVHDSIEFTSTLYYSFKTLLMKARVITIKTNLIKNANNRIYINYNSKLFFLFLLFKIFPGLCGHSERNMDIVSDTVWNAGFAKRYETLHQERNF